MPDIQLAIKMVNLINKRTKKHFKNEQRSRDAAAKKS